MAKKDFSGVKTDRMYKTIAEATAEAQEGQETAKTRKERKTYTAEEEQEFLDSLKTAGRKGVKLPRINMAFTPSNHEFIKVMARASGRTMTEFTNLVIAAYQREHPEILEQARGFLDTVNSGAFSSLLGGENED